MFGVCLDNSFNRLHYFFNYKQKTIQERISISDYEKIYNPSLLCLFHNTSDTLPKLQIVVRRLVLNKLDTEHIS